MATGKDLWLYRTTGYTYQQKLGPLCDKVCQWVAAGLWFSPGTPVDSKTKTNCHVITEILLKVSLNTLTPFIFLHCLRHDSVRFELTTLGHVVIGADSTGSCKSKYYAITTIPWKIWKKSCWKQYKEFSRSEISKLEKSELKQ
jgi:hypothetical protein